MREFRFKQVDVFTRVPYRGNPVAVIFDADGLSIEEMGAVASWTNLSEATFVQTPDRGDYRLRIFNRRSERPFAGHPTIGSALAVIEEGLVDHRRSAFVQECFAGLIPITVDRDKRIFALAPAPKVRRNAVESGRLAEVTRGVSLTEALIVDVGPVWMVARIVRGDIYRLDLDITRLANLSRELNCTGLTIYQLTREKCIEVRSFAPAVGVVEDPVCGSGNAAVAAHIRLTGLHKRTGSDYVARQGRALDRDGFVHVKMHGQDVMVGGHAVTCVDGVIRLPEVNKVEDIRRWDHESRKTACR